MYNSSIQFLKLVSDTDRQIYEIVNYVVLTSAVSVFGVITNIINIIVFYKQGFSNTMNISFLGLAVSDLCSLVSLLWFGVCVNPLFIESDIDIMAPEILHLTAGIPHICFTRITGWITVFVTAERCFCIIAPLKVKQIITVRRTTFIVVLIYIIIMASFGPEYATIYFDYKFYVNRNRSLIGLAFTSGRQAVEGLVFIMYSVLGSASFLAVITFTAILAAQLHWKSQWRQKACSSTSQAETAYQRHRKTIKMVVMIAAVLIVCYIPGVTVSVVTFVQPDFSVVGRYSNAFFAVWSFAFLFDAINSSVNIFLYYHMSSKYQRTFHLIFDYRDMSSVS